MPSQSILRPARNRTIAPLRAALAAALCAAIATAHADCIDDAAARHGVNSLVLRAIGWQESQLQPAALGHNANGSVDVGAFQINSVHLSELGRYGIARAALFDGCVSAEVAAWHYRRQIDQHGDSWQAVGAYHSRTPARAAWYANQIASLLMRWHAMPASVLPFPADRRLAPGRPPPPPVSSTGPSPSSKLVNAAPPRDGEALGVFSEIAYLPPAH
ncbi:lytic transglycosylase domain-containing protein [Comamonadaceae bacterium BS-T2-15]|uniref:Lytic transglycosylase domain-containing protein n=1 Tax=Scleromatobacter humisilvae TaxID=2897159 RepID=A0A9X2C2L4_9BURK|nr:lytic transglycosylase domain-containing protein [Scleromatobacter humisilvae]MCK9686989.1 lytic transglycosylase domain-containing protein [Scleromatobacter humisilvae]